MGTTRYDDFTRPMDPGLAVQKINAAFGGIDPHDHNGAGRGGVIPGSAISGAVTEATHAASADNATHAASADNGVPVGTIFPYAGSTAPDGYLLCYGQAVSRATYSALFAVIGTTYGVGDGTTTFNLPNMRGRVVIGLDNMGGTSANAVTNANADILGGTGGEENHTLSINETPSHNHGGATGTDSPDHTHSLSTYGSGSSINVVSSSTQPAGGHISTTGASTRHTHSISVQGGNAAHNNMQPWIALNYIIKY